MFLRCVAAVTLMLSTVVCLAESPPSIDDGLSEGKDYTIIAPAVPTADASKIEVVEVFGYSCVHCAHLQPEVDAWKPELASDVQFSYMPTVSGGVAEVYARAYYAAETMGLLEKMHAALFNALHVERRPVRSVEDVAAFFSAYGTTQDEFMAAMQSFAVNAKIARARQMLPRYGAGYTPSMIVNGKYLVMSPRQGGFPRMLAIVDALIARERVAMAAN